MEQNIHKTMKILGWIATVASIAMYISYIPQIVDNLEGHKANPIQPMVASINCSLWVIYALFKKHKDYPVALANLPGVFFGAFAFYTSL